MAACDVEIASAMDVLCYTYRQEINHSFMKPDLRPISYVCMDYFTDEERELFADATHAIRLSAPGYMDCTDWTPVAGPDDLAYFFRAMFD